MSRFGKQFGVALIGVVLLAPAAQAQIFRPGLRPFYSGPFAPSAPMLPVSTLQRLQLQNFAIRNFAHNTAILGRAAYQVPPWVYGYNAYPSPFINYGNPYPFYYGYNPYALYSSVYNPYLTGAAYSPYNPYGLYGYSYLYQ